MLLMIGYFFVGIEVGRPVQQAVEIADAAAVLHRDGHGRLPAGGEQARDVGLLERQHHLAGGVAQHRGRGDVRLRVVVDEVLARRRQRHGVVGVFRRQQLRVLAVHAHAIEVTEVRIAAALAADALEEERAAGFVHARQLRDVAVAARDRVLLLAGLQVVHVEVAPVVALREPDRLVRTGQVLPVHLAVARFEERLALLLEHVANGAGGGVGHAQVGLLVIARGRDERHLAAVRIPLHVHPLAAALDVVAERRAVLVGAHLQADHLRRRPRR